MDQDPLSKDYALDFLGLAECAVLGTARQQADNQCQCLREMTPQVVRSGAKQTSESAQIPFSRMTLDLTLQGRLTILWRNWIGSRYHIYRIATASLDFHLYSMLK
ncbi:hypothetical protein KIN20_035321 [Parelaphostrongylus tenuis]|uniref:Uncharacterized protein n=1 Tax=Parelaphostrongylus tenuis TaxID=148309 RepID=A0AAD5RAY6_PARTN|nr:hypothetical protein KIN20_035321 [Parelaphostrongylus tenuis]